MDHQAKALTVTSNGGLLPELRTPCQVVAYFDPRATPKDQRPTAVAFSALWDTGASHSAITANVVKKCGLKPTGMKRVETADGGSDKETFLVNILLPNGVGIAGLEVACVNTKGADVLLGMDIITRGDFSITNQNGNTKFSFRLPSLHTVDFVEETKRAIEKHRRNVQKKNRRSTRRKRH